MTSILITQCLQNDFVKPIGRYDPLPNLLHVGCDESTRLMGQNPREGPIATVMRWAYEQPDQSLRVINIRDWHDPKDPAQAPHLAQFGTHCIQNTPGAEFVFESPHKGAKQISIIDSITLSDFHETTLESTLTPFKGRPLHVGIMGVWTEAKIFFLAYELRTRYPEFTLGISSALTASSSRAEHFLALDKISRLLGVNLYPSVGEFIHFLGGSSLSVPLIVPQQNQPPHIEFSPVVQVNEVDQKLIRYLFRDSKTAKFSVLDGGFSGNLVAGTESTDLHGHLQAPHVIKIGSHALIGQERASFERIESVLGNTAPRVVDFADYGERGAIKYRYAAMGGGTSTSIQKLYQKGAPLEKIEQYLRFVFIDQLGRLYKAGTREKCNLLEYYAFSDAFAPGVRRRVEALLGAPAEGQFLALTESIATPNICAFYERELTKIFSLARGTSHFSYVHGDLNGANIIVDGQENVWLIDFFHTHRGHILKDLIKFENDLLYIFTPVESDTDLEEAVQFSDILLKVEDLAEPPPPITATKLSRPQFRRAYHVLLLLRSLYADLIKEDRNVIQLLIGQLRYAVHTLGFDECTARQKQWALYTAGHAAEQIKLRLTSTGPLRVDWLPSHLTESGQLGITILPGRKDRERNLDEDLTTLTQKGVTHIACLISPPEFQHYGVTDLLAAYNSRGFASHFLPIFDQAVSSQNEMRELIHWISSALSQGGSVLIHCVGGLGRSGMAAACYLRSKGLSTDDAIAEVRSIRSDRAIESGVQERFVKEFAI